MPQYELLKYPKCKNSTSRVAQILVAETRHLHTRVVQIATTPKCHNTSC